jgi:WhiB family transcriptional regulator, redox-sensing transcriptional regulator
VNPNDKCAGPGDMPRPFTPTALTTASAAMGDWVQQAACAGANPETFFPASGERDATAKAMCASCPVRPDCLEYSLRTGPHWGVWGGLNDTERGTLARRRKRERQRSRAATASGDVA